MIFFGHGKIGLNLILSAIKSLNLPETVGNQRNVNKDHFLLGKQFIRANVS